MARLAALRVPAAPSALVAAAALVALAGLQSCSGELGDGTRPNGASRTMVSLVRTPPEARRIRLERISEVRLPASAVGLTVSGGALYVSMAFDGLATYDVSDPRRPELIHRISGMLRPDDPEARVILGTVAEPDRLLALDRVQGLSIYDRTDPLRPKLQWSKQLPGDENTRPIGLTRVGDFYYLACGGAGLRVLPVDFDAETPAPRVLDQFDHSRLSTFFPPHWLLLSDGYETGMQVLNIENPMRPRAEHQFQTGTFCDRVHVMGRFAVLANRARGFTVVDLSDPVRPFLANYFYTSPADTSIIKSTAVWRDRFLIAGNAFNYIEVFDLESPDRPILDQRLQIDDQINAMIIEGDLLYAALWRQKKLAVYRIGLRSGGDG